MSFAVNSSVFTEFLIKKIPVFFLSSKKIQGIDFSIIFVSRWLE